MKLPYQLFPFQPFSKLKYLLETVRSFWEIAIWKSVIISFFLSFFLSVFYFLYQFIICFIILLSIILLFFFFFFLVQLLHVSFIPLNTLSLSSTITIKSLDTFFNINFYPAHFLLNILCTINQQTITEIWVLWTVKKMLWKIFWIVFIFICFENYFVDSARCKYKLIFHRTN